jgi:hypothetical protein
MRRLWPPAGITANVELPTASAMSVKSRLVPSDAHAI